MSIDHRFDSPSRGHQPDEQLSGESPDTLQQVPHTLALAATQATHQTTMQSALWAVRQPIMQIGLFILLLPVDSDRHIKAQRPRGIAPTRPQAPVTSRELAREIVGQFASLRGFYPLVCETSNTSLPPIPDSQSLRACRVRGVETCPTHRKVLSRVNLTQLVPGRSGSRMNGPRTGEGS